MCGIFAYLNYCTPKKRDEIVAILIQSLHKLAYKSYDSAGEMVENFQPFVSIFVVIHILA